MISPKHILHLFEIQENKYDFFITLSYEEKIYILENIHKKIKNYLISNLSDREIIEIFERIDPDQVTDILQDLDIKKKSRVYLQLNKDLKTKVDLLLKFSPNSAAGIMSLNYILVSVKNSKKEIILRIKKHLAIGKKEPTILVMDKTNHLVGELRISKLLLEKDEENLFTNLRILQTVKFNEDQKECIDIFKKNKNEKIVVLDDDEYVLGIINAKDIFKIIEETETEDFYAVAGVDKNEDINDSPMEKIKFRFSWLLLNLFTAFIATYVISLFQETISKVVILSAFMPLIAGMGGNAGAQTTAVLIRSLALKKIDSNLGKKILLNETTAGFINGFLIGSIVTVIAYILNQNLLFGVIVGITVWLNLIVASFFGTLIPLTLKLLGYDPAVSSSIFITTLTDIIGFSILLILGTKFLL